MEENNRAVTMESFGPDVCVTVTIQDVLGVDLCARAILEYVPIAELVRSERVSRRWRRAALDYLRTCRTLALYDDRYTRSTSNTHRNINISVDESSILACKIVNKLGNSIVKVVTERSDEEYFEVIASNCPYLRQIKVGVTDEDNSQLILIKKFKQFKHISLRFYNLCFDADQILGELFRNVVCENIEIIFVNFAIFTGRFLENINSNSLKSLSLRQCDNLTHDLLSGIYCLRNITSLGLDDNGFSEYSIIHLLLKEMPQLEELSLNKYESDKEMSDELIESFSRLANLKRLNMRWNYNVSDTLLEALARGCRKLEYLNICGCSLHCVGSSHLTARGLAALCRRSPSAVTTFYFGHFEDVTYDEKFVARLRDNPLMPELAAWCCLELTPQWWEATCLASRGRTHPVELNLGCNAVQDPRHKLSIVSDLEPPTRSWWTS